MEQAQIERDMSAIRDSVMRNAANNEGADADTLAAMTSGFAVATAALCALLSIAESLRAMAENTKRL